MQGLSTRHLNLFGVDEIVPDYKMLLEHLPKIKGFFMTHAHEDHIGALSHIIERN